MRLADRDRSSQQSLGEESRHRTSLASHRGAQRRSQRNLTEQNAWAHLASQLYLSEVALTPLRGRDLPWDINPHVGEAIEGMRKEPLSWETDLIAQLHHGLDDLGPCFR